MTKLSEPVKDGILSTRDIRERVSILEKQVQASAAFLIERQKNYPEPNPEKIAFHVGRISAAQTFRAMLTATPEEWDALIEAEAANAQQS